MLKFTDRTGEVAIASNGMQMRIIAYRSYGDIDVEFEDGSIALSKDYSNFKRGKIGHPSTVDSSYHKLARLGEISKANNGMQIKIVAYRAANDVDVEFEDGFIAKGKTYKDFKEGVIGHNRINANLPKKERLGEVNIANNGMRMKIVGYRNANDIDVQFEDGTVVENVRCRYFKSGEIRNPNYDARIGKIKNARIGKIKIATNGLRMRIIAYRNAKDIDIQFEDGVVVKGKKYSAFYSKSIAHPDLKGLKRGTFYGYKIKIRAYKMGNSVYYVCDKGNGNEILTLQDILQRQGIKPVF